MKMKMMGGLAGLLPIAALTGCGEAQKEPVKQPNVLLILADDMGYSDIGCYGGEMTTPNLDSLAMNGIRFTQFYNTARSCPSRASLMTGLHPAQTGIGHMTHKVYQGKNYQGYLNDECTTLAEVASSAGYATAISGKWHMGTEEPAWPVHRGFQQVYAIHNWVDSYWRVLDGCEIYQQDTIVQPAVSKEVILKRDNGEDFYTTDVFTDKAIEQIDRSLRENPDKPFFSYLAFNAPHWPLEAHDSIIAKHLGEYDKGWNDLIVRKTAKMKELGIIDSDTAIGWQEMVDWESLSDDDKENSSFRRAIYAAQIEIMDYNVGRMVQFLKEKGVFDNTIIIFLSDNGCSAEPENQPMGYCFGKNRKSNYNEWKRNSARVGASQGKMWAIASNAPFRYYKKFLHEGGISTPLIISYPDGVKNPGSFVRTPCYLPDIMATFLDFMHADYPQDEKIHACEGRSLMPAVYGHKLSEHKIMCWEHEGHGAIRMGKWKLVTTDVMNDDSWELYDLSEGRSEIFNRAIDHPEKVREMLAEWKDWAARTGVLPRQFRPKH